MFAEMGGGGDPCIYEYNNFELSFCNEFSKRFEAHETGHDPKWKEEKNRKKRRFAQTKIC